MPRISPRVMHDAFKINYCLPLLLPECRTIENAQQEYKWIHSELSLKSASLNELDKTIKLACIQRFHHVPLQYILRSQPFGYINISCKKNVLIPRWETEEWTLDFVNSIKKYKNSIESLYSQQNKLNVVDLCTGTGCIALLLRHEFNKILDKPNIVQISAFDCSKHALRLADHNKQHSANEPLDISIKKMNVLRDKIDLKEYQNRKIDILLCNPPYIPRSQFIRHTSKSVRFFEPKLALIGNEEFYENLVDIWLSNINSFIYEVGNQEQIDLVKKLVSKNRHIVGDWVVDQKNDSNRQPRLVFGYRNTSSDKCQLLKHIFDNFSKLKEAHFYD
ncbi:hypothetical protein TPHA_0C03130 [Tetrapisispora phaffii CBS 4417]|uniref:peptide chain release factor N(5)-glutamine methyltransferase n=1 Tax=Tetrapisispora phaffii (strain ATCC 24235 / CBS 4417 / NBRC 1672 / NRRL Y-8282 / UCD 70-5) TaxID=1071381 RepID=G8BRU0_TETPH|nr:hypothetical protein TPHA_0C03130 [Tetrapisispora phaffii CBS 4417]CCE62466.1 hypothetical protein TPHA_0C03130 [Tetrapisispora phaffii CBS 4417]